MKLALCVLFLVISIALAQLQLDPTFLTNDQICKRRLKLCSRRFCPRSCRQIKTRFRHSKSGQYYINIRRGALRVYCEMSIAGGGFTFLPKDAARVLSRGDIGNIFRDRKRVLFRILTKTGLQTYTEIRQLRRYRRHHFSLFNNYGSRSNFGYPRPINYRLGHYFFLSILPLRISTRHRAFQGFRSNGRSLSFRSCGANEHNYFAFFPNEREGRPNSFLKGGAYERGGLAVNWRRSARGVYSLHQIPTQYFFFTEMHFGGCGTYTSSNRWRDALGTAFGLR